MIYKMLVINVKIYSKNYQIKNGARSKFDKRRLKAEWGSIGYANWQCILNIDRSKNEVIRIFICTT